MRLFIFVLMFSAYAIVQAEDFEKPHHLSLFMGGTHVLNEDHTGETFGVDYEYRVSKLLGVGFVAEHAFGEVDSTTLLAVADIHTPLGFILQIGPGVEIFDEDEEGNLFIFRVGGLYEFEFDAFTVSPQFHVDFADNADDSLVFGLAIGSHF